MDRKFQILNVDGLLENIKVKNTSKSQDILSALENKYYHSSKVSEKIYIDLQNAVADELLEYIFLIRNLGMKELF